MFDIFCSRKWANATNPFWCSFVAAGNTVLGIGSAFKSNGGGASVRAFSIANSSVAKVFAFSVLLPNWSGRRPHLSTAYFSMEV